MKRFLQRILQKIMKKILGTSDAWSMRPSSHRPIDPAYHIEDWRISSLSFKRKSERIERIVFNKTQALGERGGNIALGNKI